MASANNLGTAYIKIAPQMEGIQSSITKGLQSAIKSSTAASTALGTVIAKGISTAMSAVSNSLDRAISRVDTLNAFPKIMKNLGFAAEESQSSIDKLASRIEGLPTGLDEIVNYTQRLASTMGNLNKDVYNATNLAIAFNDAALAGGKGQYEANRAFEQFSQVLSRGRPSMQDWKIMMEVMPGQLKQMAKYMGTNNKSLQEYAKNAKKTVDQLDGMDLYNWISENKNEKAKERLQDLTKALIDLDNNGGAGITSFKDQVGDATHTIGNALSLIPLRISKAVAAIINAFGSEGIYNAIDQFSSSFAKVGDWIIKYMVPPIRDYVIPALKTVLGAIGNIFKAIGQNEVASKALSALIYAFVGFKAVKSVIPVIKSVSTVVGGLASKLNIFKGAQSLGSGLGGIVASILKPLGSTEVLKGAASAALVAAGVWAFAEGISKVSTAYIDWGKVALMEANMAAITAIIAAIGAIAGTGAIIGGVATAVISGGLWLFASALADLTPKLDSIKWPSIYALSGHIGVLSGILTAFVGLSAIGAIGAVADAVIGGGLLVAAIGLASTSVYAERINLDQIKKFTTVVAEVGTILGLLAGFSIFGAIGSIADAILSGGLLVSAIALEETQKHVKGLNSKTFQKFTDCLGQVSSALAIASIWSGFGAISAILNDVISGGVLVAAIALEEASKHIKNVKKDDYERLSQVFKEISSWETGGILDSFGKMLSSGNLKNVANHVRETAETLNRIPTLPEDDKINRLKDVIKNISTIEIHGSGLFENRGGAAEELEKIVGHVVNIGTKLNTLPWIDYDKTARLVDCIKIFDRIDDKAKAGIMRLSEAKDSFLNIVVITATLLKVPDNLPSRAQLIVDSLKKFEGFNATAISVEAAAAAVAKLLTALIQAMQNGKSRMFAAGALLAEEVRNGVASYIDRFAEVARNLQGAFWGALEGKLQDEYNQGKALANKVKSGIDSVVNSDSFRNSGKNAGNGLINGLKTTFTTAYQAGRNIAQRIIDGIKARGQEGSPWKTTFQSGIFAGQGLAEGLLAAKDDVVDAATVIADATQDALGLDERGFSVGSANTHLLPNTDLTSGISGSGGQVTQYNTFNVDSELDVKDVSKRLGWQVATAL